jgi:hypothetical protein
MQGSINPLKNLKTKREQNNVVFSPERLTGAKKGVDDWDAEPVSL